MKFLQIMSLALSDVPAADSELSSTITLTAVPTKTATTLRGVVLAAVALPFI
jgi:hypothetical protein